MRVRILSLQIPSKIILVFNKNAVSLINNTSYKNIAQLKIVSYNVAGLRNKSIYSFDFYKYINSFDIFCLLETFVEKEFDQYEGYFRDFYLHWQAAVRTYNRGRASGGTLIGIRKTIHNEFSCRTFRDENITIIEFGKDEKVHIIPVYINSNAWERDFASLYEYLLDKSLPNAIIIGDCNARIGGTQLFPEFIPATNPNMKATRKAKDNVVDGKGKKLIELCETFGFSALNGRCTGDEDGEFTFLRGNSQTTIDYCLASTWWLERVTHLQVEQLPYSDHMPPAMEITVEGHPQQNELEQKLLPKYIFKERHEIEYKVKLDQEISSHADEEFSAIEGTSKLVECIKAASNDFQTPPRTFKPKQPWYDYTCEQARKKMFGALRAVKKNATIINRQTYKNAKIEYKALCNEKMRNYLCRLEASLSSIKDSKELWSTIRQINGRKHAKNIQVEGSMLAMHFQNLLQSPSRSNCVHFALPYLEDLELDAPILEEEVLRVINRCKNNKAPGTDRIPAEFFKHATPLFIAKLTQAYNYIFEYGDIPPNFRDSIIFPIFKKGEPSDPRNYRGISFLNAIYKIFAGVILERLTVWVEKNNLLSEFQAGFRKGYATVDNIFCLTGIVQIHQENGKTVYAFFVDFKAAFDLICRIALIYKLSNLGLSYKMIQLIKNLLLENKTAVWCGDVLSDWFQTDSGVKQGCLLSPLLFALFIEDLKDHLTGGIRIADIHIKLLMYADDIILLAESPTELQKMIDELYAYCQQWNLTVNTEKSKIMVFKKHSRRQRADECWLYNGEPLEVVKQFKYLGTWLTPNMSFSLHLQHKLADSKIAINSTWKTFLSNTKVPHSTKYKLFEATAKAVLCYCAQVWGIKQYDDAEKLLRYFLKKFFHLPPNTPNYMLHLETGLPQIYQHTIAIHFNYINKVMEMDNIRLPKIIAQLLLRQNLGFANDWRRLADQLQEPIDLQNTQQWRAWQKDICLKLEERSRSKWINEAQRS